MKYLDWMVLGTVAMLAGCGADPDSPVMNPMPGCLTDHREMTSDGHDVAVCDELYPEAPFVYLPQIDDTHVYAAIQGSNFVTRDGASYPYTPTTDPQDPEYTRHAMAIYELTLEAGSVKSFKPAVMFEEEFFVKPYMGRAYEGTISRRVGEGRYALEASLPVRIEILSDPAAEPSPGATYQAKGTIANLTEAVTAADGTCMPALSSYGAEATFPAGVSVEVRLERTISMHVFGDDEIVISFIGDNVPQGGLMDEVWFRGPAQVMRGETLTPAGTFDGYEHGSPGSIPDLTIDPVEAGGEPCTP